MPALAALTADLQTTVASNLGLVRKQAHDLKGLRLLNYEELYSEGCVGLCDAARYWQGTGKFSTYATICIKRSMLEAIQKYRRKLIPQELPDHGEDGSFLETIPDEDDPPDAQRNDLRAALQSLPSDEREAVFAAYGLATAPTFLSRDEVARLSAAAVARLRWNAVAARN